MTNQIPRALLSDIALSLSIGDAASALAMLGADTDPCRSASVAFYRALALKSTGRPEAALPYVKKAREILESRYWEDTAANRAVLKEALRALPAPETPVPPALEAVLPQLARLRALRLEVVLLRELGLSGDAEAVNGMLPAEARL